MTNTCKHEGSHLILLNQRRAGDSTTFAGHIRVAINHAYPGDAESDDFCVMESVLDRASLLYRKNRLYGRPHESTLYGVPMSDAELQAVTRILTGACEYMDLNGYASDEDFPDDAAAARALGNGSMALLCWVDTFARTAARFG